MSNLDKYIEYKQEEEDYYRREEEHETIATAADARHSMPRLVRLKYPEEAGILYDGRDTLVVPKRGGGEKKIPPSKWWINRHTPVGDDAILYIRKPYGGKCEMSFRCIIAVEREILQNVEDSQEAWPKTTENDED